VIDPVVDLDWVLARSDRVVLADVRWYLDGRSGRAAYDQGHLPGAVFVDLEPTVVDEVRIEIVWDPVWTRARIRDDPEGAFRLASGVVGTMAAAAVAWGAWQKHVRGELTWKVVGLWGGVLAAFGAGDYFLGQYVAKQSRK